MTFTDLRSQPAYAPAGHAGVVNRLLVGAELGTDQLSIWHGAFAPAGASDLHVHEGVVQVYIGLSGRFTVTVDGVAHTLEPMTSVTIPTGVAHEIRSDHDGEATLLVVSAPALR